MTERGGSVVTHETRIREFPGSNPGADQPDWGFLRSFPQSSMQKLGWIFIITIHLTIIHQIPTGWKGNKCHPFNSRRGRLKGPKKLYAIWSLNLTFF